jgi:osmoprotectant transport system permease protein
MKHFLLCLLALLLTPALGLAQPAVNVGSKRFTESYILGEIVTQSVNRAGDARAIHQQGLGNTAILFSALKSGSIHLYPEYTGTIAFELLGLTRVPGLAELNQELGKHGLAASVPLGFSNSYALAMLESRAKTLGISRISDLTWHPQLSFALSQEFLNRKDGWPALRQVYRLQPAAVRGLDHGLAYEVLASGQVDVMDSYSTDAKINRYHLRVLQDDRGFFPAYDAVLLHRRDFPEKFPQAWRALQELQGRITAEQMITLNAAAELSAVPFALVAEDFLSARRTADDNGTQRQRRSFMTMLFGPDFWRLTMEHLLLVFASLALGVVGGVPLGIWAHRVRKARAWILGTAGVLQTVPSLALLAFLIAAFDRIGTLPAIAALFLYSLLPIVRNTETGLAGVPRSLKDSATALGLREGARLRFIELPLAARTVLAGIKTSAVINVGTATIAAFIGAGGYGERIVAGLAVNDHALLLAGAVPAAMMALAVQWTFDALDRHLTPPGAYGRAPGSERGRLPGGPAGRPAPGPE